jgi:hypothetical protein
VPVVVTHKFNDVQLRNMLQGPSGAVAKDLLKRGARVQSRARRNLGGATGSGPRRINTGLLRASVAVALVPRVNSLAVRVGTGVYYALYVHDGTGLYGPKHRLIRPLRSRVLVFKSQVYGAKKGKLAGKVVARYVRGMKPNPFLKDALPAFRDA